MNYNYFSLMKNFIYKDDYYYNLLTIYALNLTSVNHPQNVVGNFKRFIYSLKKDKIKELYEKVFNEYKQALNNIKEESETEKNIMKNISTTFFELCLTYISLFPTDSLQLLQKLIIIYDLLREKKYSNVEKSIGFIIFRLRELVYLPVCSEKKYKRIFNKYSGRNDIILNESQKLKINDKIKDNNNKYYQIIKIILELFFKGLSGETCSIPGVEKIEENLENIIGDRQKIFLFLKLKEYVIDTLDKKDALYQKIIKCLLKLFNSSILPVSFKYFWLKVFHSYLKDEYNSYKEYEWMKFKSEEDFNNNWNKLKYDLKGKKKNEILPVPVKTIKLTKLNIKETLNNYEIYNIKAEQFFDTVK